jgi:hypothetical protein
MQEVNFWKKRDAIQHVSYRKNANRQCGLAGIEPAIFESVTRPVGCSARDLRFPPTSHWSVTPNTILLRYFCLFKPYLGITYS